MFISLFISLFCVSLIIFMFSASIMVNKAVYISQSLPREAKKRQKAVSISQLAGYGL